MRVGVLRFRERLLGGGQFFKRGLFLLTEAAHQGDGLLDPLFQVTQRVDFGVL